MCQPLFGAWYCSFHDRYAKQRCQAFFEFQGSGMQCPELGTVVDEETGRRYCEIHDPSCVIGFGVEEGVEEGEMGVEEMAEESVESDHTASPQKDFESDPFTECMHAPEDFRNAAQEQVQMDKDNLQPTDHEHAPPATNDASTRAPTVLKKQQPRIGSDDADTMEHPRQHIAAMYVHCNVCLEEHDMSIMHRIDPCGHQFRTLCLETVLRKGSVRKYNCSSCRIWMEDIRRSRMDQ